MGTGDAVAQGSSAGVARLDSTIQLWLARAASETRVAGQRDTARPPDPAPDRDADCGSEYSSWG